jgi:hypothetical protein
LGWFEVGPPSEAEERGRGERKRREAEERGRGERQRREAEERGRGERQRREAEERGRGERQRFEGLLCWLAVTQPLLQLPHNSLSLLSMPPQHSLNHVLELSKAGVRGVSKGGKLV